MTRKMNKSSITLRYHEPCLLADDVIVVVRLDVDDEELIAKNRND